MTAMNALPDIEAVAAAIRQAAQGEAMPRFKRLQADDIKEKSPGDLVTVADVETERALNRALADLLPGSTMVGEEAVSENPALLDALREDGACWLIDPIDGLVTRADEGYVTRIGLFEDRIEVLDERLEARRARLQAQFLAMELSLANLQGQSSALLSLSLNLPSSVF